MKIWQKAVLGLLAVTVLLSALAYVNRTALILAYVRHNNALEVVENRPVTWERGPPSAEGNPADRPPNIVFILVDDLGINDLSTFGGGVADGAVPTPNIDSLARSGALFSQAYSGTATCAPSRAMLMTGRYPIRHGFEFTPTPEGMIPVANMIRQTIRPDIPDGPDYSAASDIKPPFEEMGLPSSEVTLAETLKGRGYHTVHIGKWHLGRSPGSAPNDQGFDESLLMDSGLYLPEDHPNVVNARVEFDPIDNFLWAAMNFSASFNGGERFEPGGYLTDYWTDESLKVIEANRHRPFFLYLAHWGVHTPLQATREDYEAVGDIQPHRLRVYAAMLRALDRSVGRVIAKLEQEGLSENTILVFSSDNGGAGYVGLPEINAPYRGWKMTFYEGGIRVPLFVKWPAQIAAGSRIEAPVSHIDLMPTLAAAAGASLPESVLIDGVDLLPAATGTGEVQRANDAIFWQSGDYRVVRAGDWKLQVNGQPGETWLYNLREDPTEQIELSARNPEKLAELEALLEDHLRGRTPMIWPPEIAAFTPVDKSLADTVDASDHFIFWPN